MDQKQKFLSIYPLPALLTPLSPIPFTTEEITACNNEVAIVAKYVGQNPPSCFYLFHNLLFQ